MARHRSNRSWITRAFSRQGVDVLRHFREGVEHASIESLTLMEPNTDVELSPQAEEELLRSGLFRAVSPEDIAAGADEPHAPELAEPDAPETSAPATPAPSPSSEFGDSPKRSRIGRSPRPDFLSASRTAAATRIERAADATGKAFSEQETAVNVAAARAADPGATAMQPALAPGTLLKEAARVPQFDRGPFRPNDPQIGAIAAGIGAGQLPADRPSLLVTSPRYGDGKTALAVGVALELARTGKQVCLVDADLRYPRCAELLEVEPAGDLLAALSGECSLGQALIHSEAQNLTLLPNFGLDGDAGDIWSAAETRQMIGLLATQFDVLILDGPPVAIATECYALAPLTGGVLLAVRTDVTPLADLAQARRGLEAANARLIGTVLTYA